MHLNGELTLGENIADVAGLAAAYDAYKMSLGGKPLPVVDGLTGDQRFFIAYAQSWREKIREAALRQRIVTDEHAPDRERAQTVRNLDGWYEAWDVKPGRSSTSLPRIASAFGREGVCLTSVRNAEASHCRRPLFGLGQR